MKILFIKPANYLRYESIKALPLGILYLSSYIKKYLDEEVDIRFADLRFHKDYKTFLGEYLLDYKPDVIGISMLNSQYLFASEGVELIKKTVPNSKIIVGGPYATYYYEEILKNPPSRLPLNGLTSVPIGSNPFPLFQLIVSDASISLMIV